MTDYTKLYPGKTPLDARYQYAHDLLKKYCKSIYGTGELKPGACDQCEYWEHMGRPKVCGWALDYDPAEAIEILETLLGVKEADHDD